MIKQCLIILFIFISAPCWGATKQVMVFGTDDNFGGATTEYLPMGGLSSATVSPWSTTEYTVVWPASGTITDLYVELDSIPGAGKTAAFTVRVNKATPGTPTVATCTNATACSDTTNATTISAGDEVSIDCTITNTPATSDPSWSIVWNPTTSDYTVLVGGTVGNNLGTSGTEYLAMHGIGLIDTASWDVSTLVPTGGTFRDLYIKLGTAPGAGTSRTFAFGTVDCTISDTATTCNSGVDTQAATAGQAYTLTSTVSGTPAASIVSYGIVFVPSTSGQFTFHSSMDDTISTNNEFNMINTNNFPWTGTTTIREQLDGVAFTMKNMYWEVETDIGPDTDLANLYFRVDETNSALTCQLTGVGAGPWQCNLSSDISVTSGQELSVAITDDGTTPAAAQSRYAFTGFITPTGVAARRIFTTQ